MGSESNFDKFLNRDLSKFDERNAWHANQDSKY